MIPTRPGRVLSLLSVAGLVGLCAVAQATTATAAAPSISTVKVTGTTHTSLTVTVSGHAQRFQVFAATRHKDLAVSHFSRDPHSALSRSSTVTVSHLRYTTTPYFYRVYVVSGGHHAYSNILGPVGLKPGVPSGLAATGATNGAVSLTWNAVASTGYVVTQATNATMTQNVRSYTLVGPDTQFTPLGLSKGTPYFFTVRAVNYRTKSGPSASVTGTSTANGQNLTVVTYNIREASLDGQPDGHNMGAPWDQRKGPEAALLRSVSPDVIAIEEGASYVDGSTTERQADSLTSALGSPYALANTEIPAPQKHHFRTGDYIIYNSNAVQPVGQGGHWDLGEANLGHQHWAAYQQFRCVGSGAKFLFVAFHLVVVNSNHSADDAARERQTQSMIQQAHAYDSSLKLPIVYAGDTNSAVESSHPLDGPRVAMRSHNIADTFDSAQSRHNTRYNTGNQYYRKPPASGIYLDAIFAEPGVGVTSWNQLLKLSHGRFVLPIPSDHNPVVAGVVIPY